MVDDNATSGSSSIFGSSWALFLLGSLLVVASVNDASLVVKFVAMVLVLMASLRLWTALGMWRLDLDLACEADRLFPGECFNLRFDVANRKFLPLWIRLELPVPIGLEQTDGTGQTGSGDAGSRSDRAFSAKAETSLRPFEHRSGTWTFRATRRGVHQLEHAILVAR
jgi:hypothetical protein